MKKLTALILSLLMLAAPLASCSNDTALESENDESESTAAPKDPEYLTHIFRGTALSLPEEYRLMSSIPPLYDKETGNITCLCVNTVEVTDPAAPEVINTVSEYRVVTLSSDGSTADDRLIEFEGGVGEINTGVITDDSFVFVECTYNESSGAETYQLVKYSFTDGSVTKSDSLQPLFTEGVSSMPWFYIACMAVDGDGYIYVASDAEIVVFDANFIKSFSVFPQYVSDLSTAFDGTVYASGQFNNGQGICAIDKSTEAFGKIIERSSNDPFYFGDGYDLYYSDDNGLYGMSFTDTSSSELVMNYGNSNVTADDLTILAVINKDTFLASERDPITREAYISLYKKADDIDLSKIKVIEIATAHGLSYQVPETIVAYNKEHPDCRIIVTDYSQYNTNEDYGAGERKLTLDFINGLYKPDIIIGDSSSELVRQIVKDDLYTDLYPFIDKDDKITRDDLFGAVMNIFDDDGKLYALTDSFEVRTLIGPKSVLGDRTSWTFSEMLDFTLNLPSDVKLLNRLNPASAMNTMTGGNGYSGFIDAESNTANFDSEEFIDYLEYIENLDTSSSSGSNSTAYLERLDGKIALYAADLVMASDWIKLPVYFNTEDYTIIGYPEGENGCTSYANPGGGTYIITSYCDYPEIAWEVMKSICAPEYTGTRDMMTRLIGFPILKSTFDTVAEYEYERQYFFEIDGTSTMATTYDPENPETNDDPNIIMARYTEEEHAALKEFLDTKVGVPANGIISAEITAIVDEEISVFLSGTRSAEETADIIQSRVSIWLAEHE